MHLECNCIAKLMCLVVIPIADIDDCTDGDTVTVMELLDVPPDILTTTSINPNVSKPVKCPEANFTTNPSNQIFNSQINIFYLKTHLLVESMMTPTALSFAVIAG